MLGDNSNFCIIFESSVYLWGRCYMHTHSWRAQICRVPADWRICDAFIFTWEFCGNSRIGIDYGVFFSNVNNHGIQIASTSRDSYTITNFFCLFLIFRQCFYSLCVWNMWRNCFSSTVAVTHYLDKWICKNKNDFFVCVVFMSVIQMDWENKRTNQ